MTQRIISVSTAPYDGHDVGRVLESLAACGARHVEPAFIAGYTEPFDETAFTDQAARRYASQLQASGLACHAVSAHVDLGVHPIDAFRQRMRFARGLGALIINTNASLRAHETDFFRNIELLARDAEQLGLTIGLENPGDARPNLIDTARDGLALIARIGAPHIRLNYDPGNTASHRPDLDPIADAITALPACAHLHLKAVRAGPSGWDYPPLGAGDHDNRPLLARLANLPVSIEMPARMRRGPDAQPWRRTAPLDLVTIETGVSASLRYLTTS